jgi:hypothetical protein
MDIVVWLGWAVLGVLGLLWSLVWFLISGWISTLLQILVLIATVFLLKYGWQRAPAELWRRSSSFARFSWKWLRAKEPAAGPCEVRDRVRIVRVKEPGDINVSTLLSLLALGGLLLIPTLG